MLEKQYSNKLSLLGYMVAYGSMERIRIEQHFKTPHSGQLTESESMRAGIRQMKATELPIRQQMTIINKVSTKRSSGTIVTLWLTV